MVLIEINVMQTLNELPGMDLVSETSQGSFIDAFSDPNPGFCVMTKEDIRERNRRWREENNEWVKEYKREYNRINRGKILEQRKRWRIKNRGKVLEGKRKYSEQNRGKINEAARKYREENLEEIKERQKKYYWDTRKEQLEKHREYYKKNSDRIKASSKEYRDHNKDKINSYLRDYYKNNLDRFGDHKCRAKYWGVEYTIINRLGIFRRDKYKCQLCGCKVQIKCSKNDNTAHLDHIIPMSKGGGHLEHNAQTLCKKCNLSKHNKLIGQLRIAI